MARAMTPAWSMRLLGVSCGSVVCAWGLLLILSVLGGGASHGTAFGSFGLGSLSGTIEDMNSARCPRWCSCTSQDVDCSHRGLTQIPGDLASLLLAEKL
ncbi:Protein slit [Habropoda laboriosa]|uniref:Protein slit n=1 Tax=Habropoda laboriosa TaxID=597456 RepID=A0A0L7R2R3_9HYME|nr:Protein slit [Habropoda laboriosa]